MQTVNILSQTGHHRVTDDYPSYLAYKKSLGKQLLVLHWGNLHCLWQSHHWMWRHKPGGIGWVNLVLFDWSMTDFDLTT